MENVFIVFFLAFIVDFLVGDPRWLWHPTQGIGWSINVLERILRPRVSSPLGEQIAGSILVVIVVALCYLLPWLLISGATLFNTTFGLFVAVLILATTIAGRSLAQAGIRIYRLLSRNSLTEARRALGEVVSRDTHQMEVAEVVRGAVETIAENTVDGVVSPLFYALLGGPPLAMAYRAVNTLDAMLGYRNVRYQYFGMAAARLDDAANYIPARLAGILLLIAGFLLKLDFRAGWRAIRRDARNHLSPNSGVPEAAVAGMLGIRLGGWNNYEGTLSFRAYLGLARKEFVPSHIMVTVKMMYLTSVICWLGGCMTLLAFHR